MEYSIFNAVMLISCWHNVCMASSWKVIRYNQKCTYNGMQDNYIKSVCL